jgi:hypothetical protein
MHSTLIGAKRKTPKADIRKMACPKRKTASLSVATDFRGRAAASRRKLMRFFAVDKIASLP